MKISKQAKKAEAVHRMEMMGIFSETIKQFEEEDKVSISESPFGAFYWVDDAEKKLIAQLEEKYDALVYMVIRAHTTMGRMDSFVFVSDHQDEWNMDREDIQNDILFAYVHNYSMPDCSELGYIGFRKTTAGGLVRIY